MIRIKTIILGEFRFDGYYSKYYFKLISKYCYTSWPSSIQGHTHQLCCNSKLLETDFWRICMLKRRLT